MTYAQFGKIQAADFNTLVGTDPTSSPNTLNAVWATGGGSAGYGQTAIGTVATTNNVAVTAQWGSLIANTASAATHQGSSITSVSAPVVGGTVTYNSAIPTNLTTIYTNKLNASTQGSSTSNTLTRGSSWQNLLLFTHTVQFANGDAARYFFNSGGQIKMTVSNPGGNAMDNALRDMCIIMGTLVQSAPTGASTARIAGTDFTGITQVGGAPFLYPPTVIDTSKGYYGMSITNVKVYQHNLLPDGPSSYLGTNITYWFQSNGTQGSHSDTGSTIIIQTIWDEVPDGYVISAGATTTCTVVAPETTNIANTWGAFTVTGSLTGT